MRRWLWLPAWLALGCAGSVAGPPDRTPCFVGCLAEMHNEFAAWCPNGSKDCKDRSAIIDRARECEEKCP